MSTSPESSEGMGTETKQRRGGRFPEGSQSGEAGRGQELREELNKVGQIARDAAYEQMDYLRDQGRQRAHQLEDRIIDQPIKSVAIALGAGFLLGMMWRR